MEKKWEISKIEFQLGTPKPDTMDPIMNPTKVKPTHPVRWQQMPCSFIICFQANISWKEVKRVHMTPTSVWVGGWMDGWII